MSVNLVQSASEGQQFWASIDSKGHVHFDENHFLSTLVRSFLSFTGLRNYDLAKVLPKLQKAPHNPTQASNVNFLFEKLAKKAGLSTSDFEHLKLLSHHYRAPKIYDWEQTETLRTFVEESVGNKTLNQSIKKFMSFTNDDSVIHRKALKAILTFSYKTGQTQALEKAVEKVRVIEPRLIKAGITEKLRPYQKLTHKDLIVMEDMAKLVPILRDFKKMGLCRSKAKPLSQLASKIHTVSNFTRRVQNIAERQVPHAKIGEPLLA